VEAIFVASALDVSAFNAAAIGREWMKLRNRSRGLKRI
jgi:hypothetical protein